MASRPEPNSKPRTQGMGSRIWISSLLAPPRLGASEQPAPWWLIGSAMLIGVVMGVCGQMRIPMEERLLDGSLVLSGQVLYPDHAVMGLYYKGMWTMLYQLGALVLKMGVSYSVANYLFLLMPPALFTGAL